MKLTIGWLRDFVEFDWAPEELADKLDLSGTEVENLSHLGAKYDKIVVGEVKAVERHPQADRLSYCEVRLDGEQAGIVCGAPNVKSGQIVPVALPGAILPNGTEIKSTRIRGVMSEGMICSEMELELGTDGSGIMVLPRDTQVGISLAEALGLDDWVLELEITPNRPDCMGVIGVAREVAALSGGSIRLPRVELAEADENISDKAKIIIDDPDLCPRYSARFVEGVKVGPAPFWLSKRLEAVGIRSINNVVDVTNYVMMETGQPLHAFDFKALRGGQVIVRRAKSKEKIETIDHLVRELNTDNLVIADCERAVALAGVMGGLDSEISDDTTDILIESAHFAPANIRKTSRSLGLISDSSLRFEKGVDVGNTVYAAERAAQLIAETAGGHVLAGTIDEYPNKWAARTISLRVGRAEAVLGVDVGLERATEILERLELKVEPSDDRKGELDVTIPSFRVDLVREVDLIEEVARFYGLNNIPAALLPSSDSERGFDATQALTKKARLLMASAGLTEVVNYSFIGRADLDRLALPDGHPLLQAVPMSNPLSEDQSLMRTSLIPSLLRTISHNCNRGQKDLGIFEVGHVFASGKGLPRETLMIGGALTGNKRQPSWHRAEEIPFDFYDVKGILEIFCQRLPLLDCHIRAVGHPLLQPGRAVELVSGNTAAGFAGALNPRSQAEHDLRQTVFIFQLAIERLLEQVADQVAFNAIPRFPPVVLDLALVVEEEVPWERLRDLALETGAPLLTGLRLFDLYRGPEIAEGKKSLAFGLTYQAEDRTLTDSEVAHIQGRIVKRAQKELGAELRD